MKYGRICSGIEAATVSCCEAAQAPIPTIISRLAARKAGLTRYFTGKPCPKGHIAERHIVNGRCCACGKAWKAGNRDKVNAAQRIARRRDPAKTKAVHRAHYYRHLEKNRQKARDRARVQKEKLAEKAKAYYARSDVKARCAAKRKIYSRLPHVVARRSATRRALLATDPHYAINQRMRSRVRWSLLNAGISKRGRRWEAIVGYSTEELHRHLERQFLPGMSWRNMGEWHIDHILPLASFDFTCEGDEAFKHAWALTNLRPLWAEKNREKKDRRETLL